MEGWSTSARTLIRRRWRSGHGLRMAITDAVMEQERNSRDIADVARAVRQVMEAACDITHRPTRSETAMRYAIIDPILWSLGWRTWLPWECGPEFRLGRRGRVDYALFDDRGNVVIFVNVQSSYTRRRYGRIRLRECVRGATDGVGVLIYGSSWEIYDLSRRTRLFDDKYVATLKISLASGDEPDYVASVLTQWIGKAQWWPEDDRVPQER